MEYGNTCGREPARLDCEPDDISLRPEGLATLIEPTSISVRGHESN
jgi:hypothetical protein